MNRLIDVYMRYLQFERNASPHTIRNYRSDLVQFLRFLKQGKPEAEIDIKSVDTLRVRAFLAFLFEKERKKSSIARKLAAVRAFFKFLCREREIGENPAARVATPKLARTLPRIMTEEELNGMLDQIARVAKVGDMVLVRDYAILELLYASGLRVSELVGLDLRQVNFGDGMLLVRGKGRKERIVPFGSRAKDALMNYLPVREKILWERKTGSQALFLNLPGRLAKTLLWLAANAGASAPGGKITITQREISQMVGMSRESTNKQGQPALPAPCLRLTSPDGRSRPARDPGDAWARESVHDAEVHPGFDQTTD